MKRYIYRILGLFVMFSSGCSPQMPPPASQDAVLATEPISGQRIACFFFDPTAADFGQSAFARQSFVWAIDNKNSNNFAYLEGDIEDAFFIAKRVYSSTIIDTSRSEISNAQDNIESICLDSIRQSYPTYKLISISTIKYNDYLASRFSSFIPVVFADMDNSTHPSRLVVFGDSLSDDGNIFASTLQTFPKPPYFLGRFSNGPVWADYIKDTTNLAVRNRSYGGAQTADHPDNNIFGELIAKTVNFITGTLAQYVSQYFKTDLLGGPLEPSSQQKTIYIIWIGANDFFRKWLIPGGLNTLIDNAPNDSGGADSVSKNSVEQISLQLKDLYAVGAQNFVIINLPDFGITPFAAEDRTYHKGPYNLSIELTKIIKKFNQMLSDKLLTLRNDLAGAKIYEVDAFTIVNQVLKGAGPNGEDEFDYGLDPTDFRTDLSFYGQPPITTYKQCYLGGYTGPSGKGNEICKNPLAAFFFDSAHPSSRSHCWLSFYIHSELFKDGLVNIEPKVEEYMKICNPSA